MNSNQKRILVGASMAALGVGQASYYYVQEETIPLVFGLVLALLGLAYVWVEGISRGE